MNTMSNNRYSFAGWLAIIQAIIFSLASGLIVVQTTLGLTVDPFYQTGEFGPIDGLFLVFTAFGAYTLFMFRCLLNQHYHFHRLDTLITISICWSVFLQISSPYIHELRFSIGHQTGAILGTTIVALLMIVIGIVNILMALKLLKAKERLNDLIRSFAIITFIAGIAEVSVFLSPVIYIIVPIWCFLLGMIFLRERAYIESFS